MADNYDDVVSQLQAGGLDPFACGRRSRSGLEPTGKIIRCNVQGDAKAHGWYALHEVPRSIGAGTIIIGGWGIFRGADSFKETIRVAKTDLTAEQRAANKARIAEDRRRADAIRRHEQERAAKQAEHTWRKLSHTPPNGEVPDYLRRKGIGAHGLRYTPSGAIALPMHDGTGKIHGLQFILSRTAHKDRIARTERDKEFWPRGLAKQGHWFQIGTPTRVALIVEGYATGASLHEALGLPVAVAFDAGNLAPVARALRTRYPAVLWLLCADDDFATHGNPGITNASAAAMEIGGAWVAPVFSTPEQVGLRQRITAEVDWTAAPEVYRPLVADILTGRRKATDFNDLHVQEGLLAVRSQVEQRLTDLGWTLAAGVNRGPTGGEGASDGGGDGGGGGGFRFDLDTLRKEFALVYGSETVFDGVRRKVLSLKALRAAAGHDVVKAWLSCSDRRLVLDDAVGFDPDGTQPEVTCNLWDRWPTTPRPGSCDRLLELAEYLCSGESGRGSELYRWVLKWCAYPLQHVGAKMQTAIYMHGPEGTGKNIWWEAIAAIYGKYAVRFGQTQLDDKYNAWISAKLFALGNEVMARDEMRNLKGLIKDMITGTMIPIRDMYVAFRQERNCCNCVFLSNRIDIAALDKDDRRGFVIWTPPPVGADFYKEVGEEINNGGIAALHDYLLHLDLGDFSPHSKPPMTVAKSDLQSLTMDSTDRFFAEWIAGGIGELPAVVCRMDDLYGAYRKWTRDEGIGRPAQAQTFRTAAGKLVGFRKAQELYRFARYSGGGNAQTVEEKKTVLITPAHIAGPSDGTRRQDWIGFHVADFAAALTRYRGEETS